MAEEISHSDRTSCRRIAPWSWSTTTGRSSLRLARAMETRGFEVRTAHSVAEGMDLIRQKAPAFAVVDMRLEDGNGLDVVAELAKVRPTRAPSC